MFTRRQIVTHGAVGAFGAAAMPGAVENHAPQDSNAQAVVAAVEHLEKSVQGPLSAAFESNSLAHGYVQRLRDLFTTFLRANQKFPDFCDIGINVFYDLYDWHVKYREPLQVGRTADNRMTIRFMYTTLLVRLDSEPGYMGVPFDRT
jgi:hypothetical protein